MINLVVKPGMDYGSGLPRFFFFCSMCIEQTDGQIWVLALCAMNANQCCSSLGKKMGKYLRSISGLSFS